MKAIWNILAVMAIVNLLAIGGAAAWLNGSGRLSKERLEAVRQKFLKTIAQEKEELAAAEEEVKRKQAEEAQAKKMAQPPVTATEQIAEQRLKDDQQSQVLLRQQQDLDNLRASLMANLAKLEEREKKLADDKKAFAQERQRIAEIEGDKHFQVALSTLEGQKSKDAEQVMKAMLEQKQTDQVVAYLARMDEGKRSKVMAEFVKDGQAGPGLAADLLERLRVWGISVPPPMPPNSASGTPESLAQASAHESTGPAAANSVGPTGGGAGSAR